ncbi:MAG: peptidoglycan-binding protein, partial [Actinobacteria bacterium]|nr:peptidoglycan-binding protein [Actinomycetota bacterium]
MPPMSWALVREGDRGPRVSAVQFLLRAHGSGIVADGSFGPLTRGAVREFQTTRGLTVDGIVGNQTWPALIIQVRRGSSGDAVRAAQVLLPPLAVDGVFGPQT